MDSRLIFLNVPVTDDMAGRRFYSSLLGEPLARALTNKVTQHHGLASAGVQLGVGAPHVDGQPVMMQFAVRDLDAMVATLEQQGAKVWQRSMELKVDRQFKGMLGENWRRQFGREVGETMGRTTIMADPWGNLIGLVQLEDWVTPTFKPGRVNEDELKVHDVAMDISRDFFQEDEADYEQYERDEEQRSIAQDIDAGGYAGATRRSQFSSQRSAGSTRATPTRGGSEGDDDVIGPRRRSGSRQARGTGDDVIGPGKTSKR